MRLSSADDTAIRLHLNENTRGPSPLALAAAKRALENISLYPDPGRARLSQALAAHLGLPVDQIAVANGSDELVLLIALTIGNGVGVVTDGTFPGYRTCLETVGRPVLATPLRDGRPDVDAVIQAMGEASVAFICNPHNPSGSVLSMGELNQLVAAAAAYRVPLVLDEAYLEFAPPGIPQASHYLDCGAPLIALRTFSKAYGLAALRVGYAYGSYPCLPILRRAQGCMPFSANRIAQEAAIAALADTEFVAEVRRENEQKRDWLCAELTRRGRGFLPSVTNFVAVAVSDGHAVQEILEQDHRILVRDAGLFGFPGYVRVSLGEQLDLMKLLEVLDAVDPVNGR